MKSTYGREIHSNEDDYVKLASDSVSSMTSLGVPGLNPVDLFPFRECPLTTNDSESSRFQCATYLHGFRECSS